MGKKLVVFEYECEFHLVSSDPAVLSGSKSCLGGGSTKIETCLERLTPGLLTLRTADH